MISTRAKAVMATALGAFLINGATAFANPVVAFLMPDLGSTRYEERDHPGFVTRLREHCESCQIVYFNAGADATRQHQQFNAAISQGAQVVVLNPVDSAAAATLVLQAQSQGVRVIAYDRPIPTVPADFYVSFDNRAIGSLMAAVLVAHLEAKGVLPEDGGILQINGSPTDAAARLIREGIHDGLAAGAYETLAEFDAPNWSLPQAQQWTSGQVARFGDRIVGIVAANDGTAGAAIAALRASGVDPLPPVTGNDATLASLQLIVAGDQFNTISKPSEIVAAIAADAVARFLAGEEPEAEITLYGTPSRLFVPTVITRENLKSEIVDAGLVPAEVLCVDRYAQGCRELGIIE